MFKRRCSHFEHHSEARLQRVGSVDSDTAFYAKGRGFDAHLENKYVHKPVCWFRVWICIKKNVHNALFFQFLPSLTLNNPELSSTIYLYLFYLDIQFH